jgi:hypothetical protein
MSVWDLWGQLTIDTWFIVLRINTQSYSMVSSLNKTVTKHFRGILRSIIFTKPPLDGRFQWFSTTESWKGVTQKAQEKKREDTFHYNPQKQLIGNSNVCPFHYYILYQTAFVTSIRDPTLHISYVSRFLSPR